MVETVFPLIVSVAAAFVGYQAGVRQDRKRWYRERRAELYIDLLGEAYAETQWALTTASKRELTAEFGELDPRDAALYAALEAGQPARLEPTERARLGARMSAYASSEVITLFGRIGRGVLTPRPVHLWEVQETFDDLEAQIRRELGNPSHLERSRG